MFTHGITTCLWSATLTACRWNKENLIYGSENVDSAQNSLSPQAVHCIQVSKTAFQTLPLLHTLLHRSTYDFSPFLAHCVRKWHTTHTLDEPYGEADTYSHSLEENAWMCERVWAEGKGGGVTGEKNDADKNRYRWQRGAKWEVREALTETIKQQAKVRTRSNGGDQGADGGAGSFSGQRLPHTERWAGGGSSGISVDASINEPPKEGETTISHSSSC